MSNIFLPAPNTGRTSNGQYSILTSKNLVSIEQGGTNANNRADALNNLIKYGTKNGDFNSRTTSGWYWTQLPSCTNTPFGDNPTGRYGFLEVINALSTDVVQRWTNYHDGDTWVRSNVNGWQSWVRYLTSNNYNLYALPLSGGTMTGTITLSSIGYQTNNIAGYYADQYGNFYHSRASTGDHWQFFNNAATFSLKYYADLGILNAPALATVNYGNYDPNVTSPPYGTGHIGAIYYQV